MSRLVKQIKRSDGTEICITVEGPTYHIVSNDFGYWNKGIYLTKEELFEFCTGVELDLENNK